MLFALNYSLNVIEIVKLISIRFCFCFLLFLRTRNACIILFTYTFIVKHYIPLIITTGLRDTFRFYTLTGVIKQDKINDLKNEKKKEKNNKLHNVFLLCFLLGKFRAIKVHVR